MAGKQFVGKQNADDEALVGYPNDELLVDVVW